MLVHFIRVQAIFVPLKISESDISDRSSSRNGRGPGMVEDPIWDVSLSPDNLAKLVCVESNWH